MIFPAQQLDLSVLRPPQQLYQVSNKNRQEKIMKIKGQQKYAQQKMPTQEFNQQSPVLMKKQRAETKNTMPQTDKIQNKKLQTPQSPKEKPYQINLLGCRSFPNILIANSYIKLHDNNPEGFKDIVSKFSKSLAKDKCGSVCELTTKKRPNRNLLNTEEVAARKGKFKRRNTFNIKTENQLFTANSDDSCNENAELVQQNIVLKQKLLECQQKISQLTARIEKLNPKIAQERIRVLQKSLEEAERRLNQKETQVQQLKNRIEGSQDEKKQLSKKLEDLMQEQQIFKGSGCSGFNLQMDQDNSGIGMDMLSTAEYIESLTDLEDELHNKKTQIFDLNKAIQQLKIKQHFTELRHEENLRRVNEEWNNKYKRLMQMYKTVKANRATDNNRMRKQPTKTEYIDQEKQDLFNLSLSTDRSQLLYYT